MRRERRYEEVRPELRTADILCFRGRGLFSALIRSLTRSVYSHAGLVYVFEGRVYCLEAVGSGVRLVLMSLLKRHYEGGIDAFEVLGVTEDQRRGVIGFAFQQLGKGYDNPALLRFLWYLLLGRRRRARPDRRWFCSEIVAEAWRFQGIRLSERAARYTSPQDIATSPNVGFRFTIKR
jgi:uncharacterized protein YycO